MRVCQVCKKEGNLHRHHVIHGKGKRKACQTADSLIDICYDCHQLVHDENDSALDIKLKLQLQAQYFKKGYSEEKTRQLMGGRLFLVEGSIWGKETFSTIDKQH